MNLQLVTLTLVLVSGSSHPTKNISTVSDAIAEIERKLNELTNKVDDEEKSLTKAQNIYEILSLIPDFVALNKDEAKVKFDKLADKLRKKYGKKTTTGGTCIKTPSLQSLLSKRLSDLATKVGNGAAFCPSDQKVSDKKEVHDDVEENMKNDDTSPTPVCFEPNGIFGCGFCLEEVDLGSKYYPRYINTEKCTAPNSACVYGSGKCVQEYLHIPFLHDTQELGMDQLRNWSSETKAIEIGCKCTMLPGNMAEIILQAICGNSDLCSQGNF